MANYPEKPKRKSGYTEKWIGAYLNEQATAKQITRYLNAIDGKNKAEQRDIFINMFIEGEKTFVDELKALAKKKRAEERAKKKAEEEQE